MEFKFKIGSKIKEVWPIYKENWKTLVLLLLITFASGAIGSDEHNIILGIVSYAINILISYIWMRFILSLVDKKEFNPFSKQALPTLMQYWNLFKTMILYGLCVMAGFILLIIPGFYVVGRLLFAVFLSVEKNQGARITIKEAWDMTKGYGWQLFWKSFLIGLFVGLGFVLLFVGGFVTYPIGMIVFVKMYREFSNMKLPNSIENNVPIDTSTN